MNGDSEGLQDDASPDEIVSSYFGKQQPDVHRIHSLTITYIKCEKESRTYKF